MTRIFFEGADALDADAVRRLAAILDVGIGGEAEGAAPLDVFESSDQIEITVDIPGVAADSVRVIVSRGTVIVAGRKAARVCEHAVAFHLAERSFGRFVRTVALNGAFDVSRGSATLRAGELRIVLPRIEERRGREIDIPVQAGR